MLLISPGSSKARNYYRDGPMVVDLNQEGAPNYFPNSFSGPDQDKKFAQHVSKVNKWNKRRAQANAACAL